MAKIAIVGVGAIGSVVAALLEEAGHEVFLCVRRPLPDLTVEREAGAVRVNARRLLSPADAPPVDWVLVATKAYDVPSAAEWLGPLGGCGCPVAVLQNGVEHRERFAGRLPPERIVPVVVDCPVERFDRAVVRQRGVTRLTTANDARGGEFAHLFTGTAAVATTTADFTTVAWRKLCGNAAGIINALLLQPTGVFRDDAIAEAGRQIVRETVEVGRAEGATLDGGIPDAVIAAIRAVPPDSVNSLHSDRATGRPMEIDARNGVVVRFGRRHGIPTPCNQLAVTLLQALVR